MFLLLLTQEQKLEISSYNFWRSQKVLFEEPPTDDMIIGAILSMIETGCIFKEEKYRTRTLFNILVDRFSQLIYCYGKDFEKVISFQIQEIPPGFDNVEKHLTSPFQNIRTFAKEYINSDKKQNNV